MASPEVASGGKAATIEVFLLITNDPSDAFEAGDVGQETGGGFVNRSQHPRFGIGEAFSSAGLEEGGGGNGDVADREPA